MSAVKAPRRRKPGLLHNSRAVEVEMVSDRMKKLCGKCSDLPETRRLVVRLGAGRHGTTEVYCETCGASWLLARETEYARAIKYLKRAPNAVEIRLP